MQNSLVTVAAVVAAALMPLPLGAETIKIGSTDYEVTRNEKQLAKGVKYIELLFPGRTYTGYTGGGRVHVIEADLTEPTVKLEMINNGSMSGTKTLANHAASVSKTGYKVVGGANGNFWITSEQPWASQTKGWPHGVAIRNGSMFTDPNVKTDPHCGGPTITGMLAVDENGKVYIDRTAAQLENNAPGSGVAFQAVHTPTGHAFDLDMCNRYVKAGTASIYNRNYGTTRTFKPVNLSSSNTWEIVDGVCTELILDLADGEEWNVGGVTKFVIVEKRLNAGTGTLGNHDLAIVGRDSYASVLGAGYSVGDEVTLSTKINFESEGSPAKIMQAISGNILAMKDGVKASTLTTDSYNKNANERTLYATNAEGNKLWILVCEHNVAQSKKYFGWSTSNMCDIAVSLGATDATQVDCGGSAQMYAGGSQVSQSYDSSGIRSVYNGMFVISTDTSEPETSGTYEMALDYADTEIAQLSGKTVKRVIANGNYLYILAHDASKAATLLVYDHANKSVLRQLGTSNCVGTHTALSDIALTEDGVLVGCARDVAELAKVSMLICKWANDGNGIPTGDAIQWNITSQGGNWTTNDTGETMAYSGTTTNGYIYYSSKTNSGNNIRWARVRVNSSGQLDQAYYNLQVSGLDYTTISSPRLFASPFDKEKFIVNGTAANASEVSFISSTRGQASLSSSTDLMPKEAAHTDIFKFNNRIYMVGANSTGVVLADITDGLASATLVNVSTTALSALSTTNLAATGTSISSGDKSLMALFVVRDGKVSKYITKTDSEGGGDTPETPVYNGERANFAYALNAEGSKSGGWNLSYSLTGNAKSVNVNLVNKSDNSVITFEGGTSKGVNTVNVRPADLDYGAVYAWEVEVKSNEIPASGQFFHAAPPTHDARGGVGIVTNPESDAYGRVVTAMGYAQGFGLYTPELESLGTYCAGTSPWKATNRSDIYRIGMREGAVAYAAAFSDAGAGFWSFDPANPSAGTANLSAGANDGSGCFTYNGNITGTGSSAVAFTGYGDDTKVWSFAEDWPSGNSAWKGILTRWDLGKAQQITTDVAAHYAQFSGVNQSGDASITALFAGQNMAITPYGNCLFLSQARSSAELNAKGCPNFVLTNVNGDVLYNSGDQAEFASCGAGLAITADGSLLALSGYRTANTRLYSVTWDNSNPEKPIPSFTYISEIEGTGLSGSNAEPSQLAFDPAGNLYAWNRSPVEAESGLRVFALANAEPSATTPAKAANVILGPDNNTGVENVSVDGAGDAPVEWYTLQGVRVSGENLTPGVYVRRQGNLTKKVLIR